MPRILWTIKAIERLTDEELADLSENNRPAMERLVNATRKQVERRIKRIEKAGLYSHAAWHYEQELLPEEKRNKSLLDTHDMSPKQMRTEMTRHKKFLAAQTSTVKGIREVNREQDLRIFGATKEGGRTPKATMTEEERQQFWSIYNEYEKQFRRASHSSDRVQEIIHEEMDNLGENATFGAVLNNASIRLALENGPVYTGGKKMSYDLLMSAYLPGEHDLDYWRKELDS